MRQINYTYTIAFNDLHKQLDYEWLFDRTHNNLVGTYDNEYKATGLQLLDKIEDAIMAPALEDRSIIVFNNQEGRPACLSTLQFLYKDGQGYLIANFRSQHKSLGRPYDQEYLRWVATEISKLIHIPINIIANVADYHEY